MDIMQEYQQIQQQNRDKYKKAAKDKILAVKPEATEDELEDIIQNGDADQVFANAALQDRKTNAKQALSYVQSRHQEIEKIEKALLELYQLFIDMSTLVEEQSELLGNIEHNVASTKDHTRT